MGYWIGWKSLILSMALAANNPPTSPQVHEELKQFQVSLQQLQHQIDSSKATLAQQSAVIDRLKHQSLNNPFRDFRLQQLLKEAHALAVHLDQLTNEKVQLIRDMQSKQLELHRLIDNNIETLAAQIKAKTLTTAERWQMAKQLDYWLQLREQQIDISLPTTNTEQPRLAGSVNDSLEDLRTKRDLLRENKQRLENDLKQVQEHLALLQKQRLMLSEVRQLLDEEAFFAESSFVKNHNQPKLNDPTDSNINAKSNSDNQNMDIAANTANEVATINAVDADTKPSPDVETMDVPKVEQSIRKYELESFIGHRAKAVPDLSMNMDELHLTANQLQQRIAIIDGDLVTLQALLQIVESREK